MPTSEGLTPNLRILLIEMPPLLRDLVSRALESRAGFEIHVLDAQRAPAFAPDVLILGPGARAETQNRLKKTYPKARVLAFTADLARLRGPGAHEECELTLDSLIERVGG